MNRYVRYTLKGIGIVILVVLVLYLVVLIYISVNKKYIIEQVTTEIAEKLNGDVKIGNIELSFFENFPQASVLIEGVSIKDSLYHQHKHTFLEAKEISILLNVPRLIRKRPALSGLKLKGGNIYVYTDTSGYTNSYLFSPKKGPKKIAEKTQSNNELKDIELEQVRIVMDNQRRGKLHDFSVNKLVASIEEEDENLVVGIEKDVLVNSLAFNLRRGSFVKGKTIKGDIEIRYNKTLKQLQFDDIELLISGHPFRLGGSFDMAGTSPQFKLKVVTRNISFPFARTVVTAQIAKALSIVNIDKPLNADVNLSGPLKGADPLVNISWETKNTHLKTPFLDFDNTSFTGSYTNEVVPGQPRKDPNSKIELKNFTSTWHGLPVNSNNIQIINLLHPTLVADLNSSFPLTRLNEALRSRTIQLKGGSGMININYKGPIEKNSNTNSFVNGIISVNNAQVVYLPRRVPLNNVFARIAFKQSDVYVENLQGVVLNNKIVMQGFAKDLLTLLGTAPGKAVVDWKIYSPSLNLASFTSLLQAQQKRVAVQATNKPGSQLERSAQQIDDVLEKGSLNVSLKADRLFFRKFEGTNVTALLSLLEDKWIIKKASLQHAGGSMELSGSLLNKTPNYHQAVANISVAHMDVHKVFESFSNFGQDGITANNLRGKLSSDVSVTMALNDDGQVYKESVEGIIDFSLKNGALINYAPMKKMQVFVFKNRNFDNITFAELTNRLEIKNEEVKINRMQIQSSVFSMFVEGIFSMKGTTDMRIQVPLSNIRSRGENYVPKNLAYGKSGGPSIYLRGKPGEDGNIKFKVDLFNKLRGDKDEADD